MCRAGGGALGCLDLFLDPLGLLRRCFSLILKSRCPFGAGLRLLQVAQGLAVKLDELGFDLLSQIRGCLYLLDLGAQDFRRDQFSGGSFRDAFVGCIIKKVRPIKKNPKWLGIFMTEYK